jgi:general secretion pathway protein C
MALVATAAYLQARGLSALAAAALAVFPRVKETAPRVASSALPEAKSGPDILERNPFASGGGPLVPPAESTLPQPPSAAASDPLSWPDCAGVQLLIVSESKDPWWSMTTLREGNEPRGRLRRVGDDVAGKRVAFIGYNPRQQVPAVWLEGRGTFCQSTLFWKPSPALPASAAIAKPDKIRRLSDTELELDRSVVNETIEQPQALLRSVRVVPEQKDGKLVGLRLFGIRPSSLLATLGLKNGDRLESINGFSVASPEKALEAYARLRTASRLSVRLSRVGKPVDLSLNIN